MLNPEQRKLLSRFASRLLNLRSGTPVDYLRRSLGSQRTLLDEMVAANLVRIVCGQYLPTFRGIEQLDDDIRRLATANLDLIFAALKRLYSRSDQSTFDFAVIVDETRRQDPSRDANDILPALVLGEDFSYYSFENGVQQRGDQLIVHSATVVERILDFTSIGELSSKLAAEEESRRLRAAAQVAAPSLSPRVVAVGVPSVPFMRQADLKRIVERDYAELERVRAVGAVKSRYVLCGGLIEALLLDALLCEEVSARAASKSPKARGGSRPKDLRDWNLGELIDVARELGIIETDAEQFSHGVRNYRNLVHPGREIRLQQKVALEEADISEKVLEIIMRELRQKRQL